MNPSPTYDCFDYPNCEVRPSSRFVALLVVWFVVINPDELQLVMFIVFSNKTLMFLLSNDFSEGPVDLLSMICWALLLAPAAAEIGRFLIGKGLISSPWNAVTLAAGLKSWKM